MRRPPRACGRPRVVLRRRSSPPGSSRRPRRTGCAARTSGASAYTVPSGISHAQSSTPSASASNVTVVPTPASDGPTTVRRASPAGRSPRPCRRRGGSSCPSRRRRRRHPPPRWPRRRPAHRRRPVPRPRRHVASGRSWPRPARRGGRGGEVARASVRTVRDRCGWHQRGASTAACQVAASAAAVGIVRRLASTGRAAPSAAARRRTASSKRAARGPVGAPVGVGCRPVSSQSTHRRQRPHVGPSVDRDGPVRCSGGRKPSVPPATVSPELRRQVLGQPEVGDHAAARPPAAAPPARRLGGRPPAGSARPTAAARCRG